MAETLLSRAGTDPLSALILIFGTATLLSDLVTSNAATVIVVLIATSTARSWASAGQVTLTDF